MKYRTSDAACRTAKPAGIKVLQASLVQRLILRLERSFLLAERLARVIARRAAIGYSVPLARPVGVFRLIMDLSAHTCRPEPRPARSH